VGRLPLFVFHFLHTRYFRVRLGSVLSARCLRQKGVLQGSVLGVTLFAISISGPVNIVGPSGAASVCMDDIAVYCTFRSMGAIEHRLEGAISCLSRWAWENGFTFFPDKTKCLHFTRLRGVHPDSCLSLKNLILPFVPTLKFLGLILDS
jgi:hypothetical protein